MSRRPAQRPPGGFVPAEPRQGGAPQPAGPGQVHGARHLTTQKSFYVEISRARDRAELVTDDAGKLKEHLEQVTGERISALEGIGAAKPAPAKVIEQTPQFAKETHEPGTGSDSAPVPDKVPEAEKSGDGSPSRPERQAELDLGM